MAFPALIRRLFQNGGAGPMLRPEIIPSKNSFTEGYVAFLSFRYNQLPVGWHFMNGMRYSNTSPVGIALNALSAEFKADWGITNNGASINVPNWFHTDGRGPVMRAVNGTARQVGSVETDGLPNIVGEYDGRFNTTFSTTGCMNTSRNTNDSGHYTTPTPAFSRVISINAALSNTIYGASAYVNMLNRGMTPGIFLGV